MRISVIVPTYNRPAVLKLCLLSLERQSMRPSEIIIADDGSGLGTKKAVQEMQEALKDCFTIRHVWQEDIGFRKPRILNETVRQSTGDYLIFIDGDCMAHRHYIQSHVENSDPNAVLSGRRVDIGKQLSERVLEEGRILNSLSPRLILDGIFGDSKRVEEAARIKNRLLRYLLHRDQMRPISVFGCNFSLYKSLFMDINGCDEDFTDGSIEDHDIGIRVLNQGKWIKSVKGLAIIFHLWHESAWSVDNEKYKHNVAILKRRIANKETICKNGIRKR